MTGRLKRRASILLIQPKITRQVRVALIWQERALRKRRPVDSSRKDGHPQYRQVVKESFHFRELGLSMRATLADRFRIASCREWQKKFTASRRILNCQPERH